MKINKSDQIQLRARAMLEKRKRKLKNSLLEFMLKDGEGDWQNAKHLDYLIKKLEKFVHP